jgi:hypothetical protein
VLVALGERRRGWRRPAADLAAARATLRERTAGAVATVADVGPHGLLLTFPGLGLEVALDRAESLRDLLPRDVSAVVGVGVERPTEGRDELLWRLISAVDRGRPGAVVLAL